MEIVNYPNYLIYDDGRLYSKYVNRFLKPAKNNKGYLCIGLTNDKIKCKTHTIHKLVASHYLDKVEGKNIIDHIDRNKLNNNVSNLRWVNDCENQANRGVQRNSKSGHKNIRILPNGCYYLEIRRNYKIFRKSFKKLEEAIEYRDNYKP
jgi:replicative superfamily II helicase